jgi:probable rRNA maturation factor
MIHYIAENIELPISNKRLISNWIKLIAADYGKKTANINYIFCTDKRILEVNKEFLKHDYYTDIITFDYSEANLIAGDIFISIDTVKSNAAEFGVNVEEELRRIIIHGILHLCGQDDKTPILRIEMTQKENAALAKFAIK